MIPIWGTSTGLNPTLDLDFVGATSLDSRITFTRGSTATFFDSTGTLQTAAVNAARFDTNPATLAPLGLLIEEQRTNSIRNNTMQGAVAGTPGTLPTNWSDFYSGTGVTRTIVGTGTENGVAYVDIRLSGTPSAAGTYAFFTETSTGVAALNAQTWTNSAYFKLQAGSLTGITSVRLYFQENNSSGNYLTEQNTAITTPTNAALNTQRSSVTRTLNQATTAFLMPGFNLLLTGAAIDITLRIGLPQLEQGAFATSVIPTTTTALTRNADVADMTGTNFSSWFNAIEGTIYAELMRPSLIASTSFANSVIFSDGTNNEVIGVYNTGATQSMDATVRDNNVSQGVLISPGAITANTVIKNALAYATNDLAFVRDAGVVQTDTSVTLPALDRLYIGVGSTGSSGLWSGYFRRIAYYPRRLPDSTLQALTA